MRKRDYHKKTFKNPHYPNRKKELRKKRRPLIVLVLIGAVLYTLFLSDFFVIQSVSVTGAKNVDQQAIQQAIIKEQKNIFLFRKKSWEKKIMDEYVIQGASINKNFFTRALTISLNENVAALVWITAGEAYYVDQDAVAVSLVTEGQMDNQSTDGQVNIVRHKIIQENLPIVYDISDTAVSVGGKIVATKEIFSFLLETVNQLPRTIGYEISHYNFNYEARTLTAQMVEGWQILFSMEQDANDQVEKAARILEENVSDTRELEYIDVRFGQKAFYK